jgi:uncharacterized protein (DUF1800 family)
LERLQPSKPAIKEKVRTMTMTRREFLRNTGLAAAYLALPAWLSACQRGSAPAAAPLAAPQTWDDPQPGAHADIVHLLSRITYGPRPGEIERVAAIGWAAFLEQQLNHEQIDDAALDERLKQFATLAMSSAELFASYPQKGRPGPRAIIQELEAASLLRAIASERQLFEIMVDFWSNHLNIYIGKNQVKWLKTADDREVIRPHALGKFRDLLLASAKSPAMLIYLDNAENIKPGVQRGKQAGGLNENYAREVMELHTVGADGGYTQDDVTTVARALTGWTITRRNADDPGAFQFVPRLHDDDAKQLAFLNLALPAGGGLKDGEALLSALASHPATATRIAHKLCVTFVADDPPQALVERAARAYLDSDTDTRATLRVILTSDEFKSSAGQKVKLPLRALVSSVRALGADVGDGDQLLPLANWLRNLGQPFFAWQSPNGYPQVGAAWVNTGGMLARWNTAFALAEGRIKSAQVDLHRFIAPEAQAAGALVDTLGAALLHAPLPAPARAALIEYAGDGAGESARLDRATLDRRLPELAGLILASPAFQTH